MKPTSSVSRRVKKLMLLSLLSACGPAEELPAPSTLQDQSQSQELAVTNGLAFNGLAFNGLNTTEFHNWFQEQPDLRNMLMSYLIQCAAASGEEALYAVSDGHPLHAEESTARGCALSSVKNDSTQFCPPLVRLGTSCDKVCIPDASKKFYTSCTYNGITYQPITTRIRTQEIYRCGDGVCQVSEKCGTGTTAESCMSDCGICP